MTAPARARWRHERRWLAIGLAGLAVLTLTFAGAPVRAQVAAAVAVMSDDLYRGVSLTGGQPAGALDVSIDDARSGAYGGAELLIARPPGAEGPRLGDREYLGVTLPTPGAAVIDLGAMHLRAPDPTPAVGHSRYGPAAAPYGGSAYAGDDFEVYAGVRRGAIGGYLYLAPDYFGQGRAAVYGEFDAAVHVAPRLRLFGHAGLRLMGGGAPAPGRYSMTVPGTGSRYDGLVGVEWTIAHARLSLGLVVEGPAPGAASAGPASSAIEAKAVWGF